MNIDQTEAAKDEAIRHGLHPAEDALWKLSLLPPSVSHRADRARLLAAEVSTVSRAKKGA